MNTKHIALFTLLLAHFLFGTTAFSATRKHLCERDKNPICQGILKLNPDMDKDEAFKLSNIFAKKGRKYKVDPYIILSISFQESTLNNSSVRTVSGMMKENGEFKRVRVGLDYCMMQINVMNIEKFKIDADKLTSDKSYCVEQGVKLLSSLKKKYSKTNPYWWTYYNAISAHHRKTYRGLVSRHLNKIKPIEKVLKEDIKGTNAEGQNNDDIVEDNHRTVAQD
jgi:hypothetical protein